MGDRYPTVDRALDPDLCGFCRAFRRSLAACGHPDETARCMAHSRRAPVASDAPEAHQ